MSSNGLRSPGSGFAGQRTSFGAAGKQMLHPAPARVDGIENRLDSGAVGDLGRGEVDQEQARLGIDRNVALAPTIFVAPS